MKYCCILHERVCVMAVVQKRDILRNSAYKEEKLCIKPDYRKYFPDAVVQKLDILRNSSHEEEKLFIKPDYR